MSVALFLCFSAVSGSPAMVRVLQLPFEMNFGSIPRLTKRTSKFMQGVAMRKWVVAVDWVTARLF
jgi:hypothetical protein